MLRDTFHQALISPMYSERENVIAIKKLVVVELSGLNRVLGRASLFSFIYLFFYFVLNYQLRQYTDLPTQYTMITTYICDFANTFSYNIQA